MILDEAFLAGGAGQQRLRVALGDLDVLWAGVRCDPLVAADREAARPERIQGMARTQAVSVHAGVVYNVEVDTTSCSAVTCAHRIAEAVAIH
jgi:chloramphenicol 3-O phosphotransferase